MLKNALWVNGFARDGGLPWKWGEDERNGYGGYREWPGSTPAYTRGETGYGRERVNVRGPLAESVHRNPTFPGGQRGVLQRRHSTGWLGAGDGGETVVVGGKGKQENDR